MLRTHLRHALCDLAKSQPELNVKQVRDILQAMLPADNVEIEDGEGKHVHGRTGLERLLHDRFSLTLKLNYEPEMGALDRRTESAADVPAFDSDSPQLSSFADGQQTRQMHNDPRFVRFIRELDKLERARRFVWIGYLAKEKLPELGFSNDEVNAVLDHSAGEGIITLGKVPNPKNPDFPATRVQLERDHPLVTTILRNGHQPYRRPIVRGEPVSETLIRERR